MPVALLPDRYRVYIGVGPIDVEILLAFCSCILYNIFKHKCDKEVYL